MAAAGKTAHRVFTGDWQDVKIAGLTLARLAELLNIRLKTKTIEICDDCGGDADGTIFNGVPGLAWDFNPQAMLENGHVNGEALARVDDETGLGHHAFPVVTQEPVLEENGCGDQAVFDLTGNKAAQTATDFIIPTAGATVFAVLKRTGAHAEHTVWWRFALVSTPNQLGTAMALAESHNFGPANQYTDKLELKGGGFYIDALDTEWVVVGVRYTNAGLGEVFIAGQKVDLYTQLAVFQGTSFNPGTEGDSLKSFTLGNGVVGGGNGLEGKEARNMGFGRALTDTEMMTVATTLRELYIDQLMVQALNGQSMTLKVRSELLTIAAAATTDTAIVMPAYSIVFAVNTRVTTAIPTAATFTVGDSGSAARFNNVAVPVAINSTDKGTKGAGYVPTAELPVRITPSAVPATNAGRVRVTIFYWESVPATS